MSVRCGYPLDAYATPRCIPRVCASYPLPASLIPLPSLYRSGALRLSIERLPHEDDQVGHSLERQQGHERRGGDHPAAHIWRQRPPVDHPTYDAQRALNDEVRNRSIDEPQAKRRSARPQRLVARDQIGKWVRQIHPERCQRGTR